MGRKALDVRGLGRCPKILSVLVLIPLLAAGCTGSRPVDVAKAFIQQVTSANFSGRASVAGHLAIDSQSISLSGEFEGSEGDSRDTVTILLPDGTKSVDERIHVGDDRFERTNGGPWVKLPSSQQTTDLRTYLKSLSNLVDVGVVTKAGRSVHHLKLPATVRFDPLVAGLAPAGSTDVSGSIDFYAEEDGTPVFIDVRAVYTQPPAQHVVASLEYEFRDIGAHITITAPTDVWTSFASERFAYTVDLPEGWTFRRLGKVDEYVSLSGPFIQVDQVPVPAGLSATQALRADISTVSKRLGGPPVSPGHGPVQIGDQPGLMVTVVSIKNGDRVVVMVAVTYRNGQVVEFSYFAGAGSAQATGLFREILRTVAFAA